MTLGELKRKVLALIEELSPNSDLLTDDPDISAKINDVINQIMMELVRAKKIPKYAEIKARAGQTFDFDSLGMSFGYDIYQLLSVKGAKHEIKANSTVIKALESGVLEVECFVYPQQITSVTNDDYVFDISLDVLELMPYGIAADLLKSDVSTDYGSVYAQRYETMLERLDPRWGMTMVSIEGGVDI